ncbi:hypothetical protein ACFQO1_03970 [Jejudonia soesokkakensis]|uniref:Anti-sigma factor n=1 Tax=Jejudonia soesokkakensis TaxID=1323432 RepID=A0ABW2MT01_9FLAO
MAQDLRDMMRNTKHATPSLTEGHEARFAERLAEAFPQNEGASKKNGPTFSWLKIASIAVTFIAVSIFGYYSLSEKSEITVADTSPAIKTTEVAKQMTLGDISPDLKKIEDFYMTGINVQLSSLEITQDNKDLIDGYMEQLSELDKEYSFLNEELTTMGPSEATITALIDNLKLRLELLFKLKNKLKELKNQNNEQYNSIQT